MFIAIISTMQCLVGISMATSMIGEQCLLLRYSLKSEREKNLGMFRIFSGLGGIVSPLLGALMYAVGGYGACFFAVGAGYILICPFIYRQLEAARIAYAEAGLHDSSDLDGYEGVGLL